MTAPLSLLLALLLMVSILSCSKPNLAESTDENGELNKFLPIHDDESIIGVSVEVSDVEKVRSLIESRSGQKLEPYDGFYGRSILMPPDLTHSVWMELFQR